MEVRWCVWVELEGVRTDITLKVPDGTTSVYSLCPIKKFVIKKHILNYIPLYDKSIYVLTT